MRIGEWQSILLAYLTLLTGVALSRPNVKADSNGIVRLNDASFRELTQAPRDHYAIILMTALGTQFNCVFCREFDPEFTVLAQSSQDADLYFGHLDFTSGQETFRALQLVSAPNLWIFPPTIDAATGKVIAGAGEPIRYDFTNSPSADAAAHFITKSIGRDFVVRRPFDYVKFARFVATIGASLVALAGLYRVAGFIFLNKNFWAVISLLLILVFNAGHMYTQIRSSPYSRGGGYIAGGFQDQFGAETQIVAFTCMSLQSIFKNMMIICAPY